MGKGYVVYVPKDVSMYGRYVCYMCKNGEFVKACVCVWRHVDDDLSVW